MTNTAAITAVTKSSIKPSHCAAANRHLHFYGEERGHKLNNALF